RAPGPSRRRPDRGHRARLRWACAVSRLFQRLGRNNASGESDRGRVGQIHAAQLMARGVQMCFYTAKGQTQDLCDLLVSLTARGPKQALLFPIRQMDLKGGQFEIDMR